MQDFQGTGWFGDLKPAPEIHEQPLFQGQMDQFSTERQAGIYSQANLLSKLESAMAKACRAHIG